VLNELYQVVTAMERRRVPLVVPHSAVEPMGKRELLLIELDSRAAPQRLKVLPSEVAGRLVRVSHSSEGSSFPGYNLPLPLRLLPKTVKAASLHALVEAQRSKGASATDMAKAAVGLFSHTSAAVFTDSQAAQFRRSMQELVGWLKADFAGSGSDLENFRKLLDVVAKAKCELPEFAEKLAACISQSQVDFSREDWVMFAEMLFGKTHLPKCKDPLSSEGYWRAKQAADEKLQVPVFLDLADGNTRALPVADPRIARQLNQHLLEHKPRPYDAGSRRVAAQSSRRKKQSAKTPIPARDAYSGQDCSIPDKFPEPKLALLGNTKLFSNNTAEAGCFFRYGLGEAETFKVSAELVEKMAGALFTLAGDDLALTALGGRPSVGRTCRGIPGSRAGKQDLLIAYLEEEPDATDPYVELFGSEAASFDTPDFAASAGPVLDALVGKVAANPNQLIRLIAIAPLDKANKQVSLNRSFRVREVMDASTVWQTGALNCPPVTLPFFDRQTKKVVWKARTVPSPLETSCVLNRVWSSNSDGGFRSDFQRIISVSDAYDIFVAPLPVREGKTRFALQTLLARMRAVFVAAGRLKATSDFKALNEPARWQVLKAVALLGILLNQLKQQHGSFMKDSTYQVGRLLALADSLHFQYCKWVRTSDEKRKRGKVDAPSELLGNSLFNLALDNPVAALARLAERIRPYKGWGDSYTSEDAGLVHWFVRQMAECERHLDIATLPARMEDIHKAQVLLGYLADHPKSETKED